MKKALVAVGILAGAGAAYAQGEIAWYDNQTGYSISIISPNPGSPSVMETGDTAFDTPPGASSYTGGYIGYNVNGGAAQTGSGVGATPLSGPGGINYQNAGNFTVGLYVAPSQSALTSDILTGSPVATTTIQSGATGGLYNSSTSLVYDDTAAGSSAWVGIAAWYSANGNSSYAASVVGGGNDVQGYSEATVPVGLSALNTAFLTGSGISTFNLATTTPEPSTIALGVIGASAFLMRLRRKQ